MCTVGVAAMAMDETRPERESRTSMNDEWWVAELKRWQQFRGHLALVPAIDACLAEIERLRAAAVVGAGSDKETPT
jgi:diadenosine tetraphosphate (Ap4A) HIT family hydrolase